MTKDSLDQTSGPSKGPGYLSIMICDFFSDFPLVLGKNMLSYIYV